MFNIFISYARQDAKLAKQIATALEERGFSVFQDSDILVSGVRYSSTIVKNVMDADAVLLLLSSVSQRTSWIEHDLEVALGKEKIVIPILLDENGKKNWIWPLVSDRHALTLKSDADIDELVESIRVQMQRELHPLVPSVAPGQAALSVSEAAVGSADTKSIEITIDRDFDSYSEHDQERLLEAIKSFLAMNGEVRIVRRRKK